MRRRPTRRWDSSAPARRGRRRPSHRRRRATRPAARRRRTRPWRASCRARRSSRTTACCKLVVFLAEDERAEALADRGHGGFHRRRALFFRAAFGGDAQRDRGLAGRDADQRLPAAADHVGQHRLDLALAGPEAMDLPAADHPPAGAQEAENRRGDRLAPHLDHFGRHAGQAKDAARRPPGRAAPPGRCPARCRADCVPRGCRRETSPESRSAAASAGRAGRTSRGRAPAPPGRVATPARSPGPTPGASGRRPSVPARRWPRPGRPGRSPGGRPRRKGPTGRRPWCDRCTADAQLLQPLAEPLGVRVERLAAGDFVADGEDFGVHVEHHVWANGTFRVPCPRLRGHGTDCYFGLTNSTPVTYLPIFSRG